MSRTRPSRRAESPEADLSEPFHRRVCEKIKSTRQQAGWTLQDLSSASGVSRSMISQIERGQANPTLAVTYRLAQALGMSLGDLVDSASEPQVIDVVRAHDQTALFRDDADCRVRTLSPLHLEKDVEFYEVTLKLRGRMESAPHFRRTREFLTVEKGRLELEVDGKTVELSRGDSAQYPADVPHCLMQRGRSETVVFLVVSYPNDSR